MKVNFTVQLGEVEVNEIVEIDEKLISGNGCMPSQKIQQMLYDWVDKQVGSSYRIIDDDSFDDTISNMTFVYYVTSRRFGWLE